MTGLIFETCSMIFVLLVLSAEGACQPQSGSKQPLAVRVASLTDCVCKPLVFPHSEGVFPPGIAGLTPSVVGLTHAKRAYQLTVSASDQSVASCV